MAVNKLDISMIEGVLVINFNSKRLYKYYK